jgi:hypothetical protein
VSDETNVGCCLVCGRDVAQDDDGFFHCASEMVFAPGYGSGWDEIHGNTFTAYLCDLCLMNGLKTKRVTYSDPEDTAARTPARWKRTELILMKQHLGLELTDADLEWPE